MIRLLSRLSGLVRVAAIVAATMFVIIALVVGRDTAIEPITIQANDPAPQTFVANASISGIEDEVETALARDRAAAEVPDQYSPDPQAAEVVLASIGEIFDNVEVAAEPVEQQPPPEFPDETTSTTVVGVPGAGATTTAPTTTQATTTTLTPEVGDETTTSTSTTTTTLEPRPREEIVQIGELLVLHPNLEDETIATLVSLINDDFDRAEEGETLLFPIVEEEAIDLAEQLLLDGIRSTELEQVKSALLTRPPPIVRIPSTYREDAEAAVADIVSESLQANEIRDDQATQVARDAARDAVDPITVSYEPGEVIVFEGVRMTQVDIDVIAALGLLPTPEEETSPVRALAIIAALVFLLGAVFMARVAPDLWQRPKLVALFGLLMVAAAAVARVPEVVSRDLIELGFLLPAALFGYLAANLFDARMAVLMAVPLSGFVALATGDLALVVYAAAATLTPIPLVSQVSSRAQLNLAVIFSAVLHIPLAGALAWYFYGSDAVVLSAVWGFVSGLASGFVALGVLPILSSLFGITTTQALLDLTDRNHKALRRIEEAAPGTFNHSILVGNLADRAARAIGANPLLARAMAYYHDLGKTVQPKYFVENQFGVTNPHDRFPPEESARIIRSHVSEGLRLAREFRIPPDVAQGILTHHGTSLMRFFYHKAQEEYGDELEPADYRHRGRKPKSKEGVILMLADATEAGTRALVQHEDPTSESLRALVEGIIAEKVEDGQLEESEVTFGELTRIKEAFVDSLIGYYHTRIPYPGFPAARSTQPA